MHATYRVGDLRMVNLKFFRVGMKSGCLSQGRLYEIGNKPELESSFCYLLRLFPSVGHP